MMRVFYLNSIASLIIVILFLTQSYASPIDGNPFIIPRETIYKDENCLYPHSCFSTAIFFMEEGDREKGFHLLKKLQSLYPYTSWSKRAAYIEGRELLDAGSSEAIPYLEEAMALKPIGDYVLLDLASAYRISFKYETAIKLYDSLIEEYGDSLLKEKALFEKSMTLIDAQDCVGAIEQIKAFISNYVHSEFTADAMLNMVKCSIESNQEEEIRSSIKNLRIFYPVLPDDKEEEAKEALSAIGESGLAALALSREERYERGKAFYKNGMYDEAVDSLGPLSDMKDERIILFAAKALFRDRRYDEAESMLRKLIYLHGDRDNSPALLDGLGLLARIARRTDDGKLLDEAEKRLSERAPASNQRGMALLYMGGYYEDRKQYGEAFHIYNNIHLDIENSNIVANALWRSAWIKYRTEKYEEARRDFSSYLEKFPRGRRYQDFLYWRGRCDEKLGRLKSAKAAYREIIESGGAGYYNYVARERLDKISRKKKGRRKKVLSGDVGKIELKELKTPPELITERGYRAAEELILLGLKKEAVNELKLLLEKYSKEESVLLKIIGMIYRTGEIHITYRIVQTHFNHIYRGGWREAPREIKQLFFPLPVVNYVEQLQQPGSADPYLVAAVMREESAFDPSAISPAGALGLMQIMPKTGKYLAKKYGKRPFDIEHLFDPDTSIHLGGLYLGQLKKRFKDDIVYTIAGYNAGPRAVSRWVKKNRFEKDEFIETIPYTETRAYTKRVLRSYSYYLRLAGKESPKLFDLHRQ